MKYIKDITRWGEDMNFIFEFELVNKILFLTREVTFQKRVQVFHQGF